MKKVDWAAAFCSAPFPKLLLAAALLAVPAWAQPAIPMLSTWQSRMLAGGASFCSQADINAAIGAGGVVTDGNVWFYDGTKVYQQIAAYTGDSSWYTCADYVKQAYSAWVLAVTAGANWPVGALHGYYIFPDGLRNDYLRTGDATSLSTLLRLEYNSAFAGSGGGADCSLSRETAFMIDTFLAGEDVGQPRNPLLAGSVNFALGHIDQWFISKTCADLQPFMVGLTFEALIRYYQKTGDPRIPPALRLAADTLWDMAWLPSQNSFYYESINVYGAPDLNLLIAPAYAWLWQETGIARFQTRGDQIFSDGVQYANFSSGKQFSQNYRSSFDYVTWRSQSPPNLKVTSTGFVYSRATGTFNGKLMVTNAAAQPFNGPIVLELENLAAGVTLVNATGATAGMPFLSVSSGGALQPGQTISVAVQFRDSSNAAISFNAVAY